MSRRYGILAAALVVVAILLSLAGRLPRHDPDNTPPPPVLETRLELSYHDGGLDPERALVPKGSRVSITLVNREREPLSLALGGYQDRVHIEGLAPGATWRGWFVADLPGDDFAWIRDGRPVGMLRVTGSHLEEGHR